MVDVRGKRRFADPEDNARRLQRIAQDSYQLPEDWLTAVNTALSLSLRHLTVLEQLLARSIPLLRTRWNSIPIP